MVTDREDAFIELAAEFADGDRWKVLRNDGWEDFLARLAEAVGDLPVRRRQALMMLLFSLVEETVRPEDVRAWLDGNDVGDDEVLEEFIAWLRSRRLDPA